MHCNCFFLSTRPETKNLNLFYKCIFLSECTALSLGSIWPRRDKACLREFANNTDADQPAHLHSLISAFVIRFLERIISKLATIKFSYF